MHRKYQLSKFVELCLGVVVYETSSYFTHTHTTLSQNFTKNFFLHTTRISHVTV